MADYVLVHGGDVSTETWNRLASGPKVHTANGRMGGAVWSTVTPFLEARGHRCFAPTLGDESVCGLSEHIAQVCAVVTENNLHDVMLVGHSYGGMIITGVAARLPERIARLVYLDADYPDPGQSLFDILYSSGHDPLVEIPGLEKSKAYTEKIDYDPENLRPVKKTFIRCTKSELKIFVDVVVKKIEADKTGWTMYELPCGHLPHPVMPEELAILLLEGG